jgi:hypothetical protein
MKIAYLGWGSLIWNSRELNLPENQWKKDGPLLPVEFVRISDNGRVTLVIDKKSEPLPVLWAIAKEKNIKDAVNLLAKREGPTDPKNIAHVNVADVTEDPIEQVVIDWLKEKDINAAIWTNLSYKNSRPSVEEIINYLRDLNGDKLNLAKEYILKAPPQIMTLYRRCILKTLGWE